ncbi:cell division transporter ATP-binding protein FtsE [Desulfocucumis palustris]|uniref:Cell division ATP-binding protein FtsE n=1 Tax=Desulfocucumis palustris TaxID=1898651 RepID=A0A2L2XHC3_9FIRM|nr:cell division ATP-binding protein FtsE [Desulfocucumis palustris]GBF35550.1 cell division transporter ATP-binding protein FtsE [Desulfocucumis palustris]
MIQLYNVSKIYSNGVKALNDVTLHVRKGEFVFLVGPSGAGKSSLIKIVFREELPSRGQALFSGKNIARLKGREIPHLRRKIGMVFQDFRLLPQKTAYENVAFAMQVVGAGKRAIRNRVPEVLAQVGLEEKTGMMPAQLSGGEQQRVCIARAIVNNPVMIIADEPTGNLDPDTSWELMNLFNEINSKGTTIVMATHAREIVDTMKKRVLSMTAGRITRDEEGGVYSNES